MLISIALVSTIMNIGCTYTGVSSNKEKTKGVADLSGYKRLYYDFYMEELKKIEESIEGIALLDLDLNGIFELIIYFSGASASGSCEVYTIEDNEVRAFSACSPFTTLGDRRQRNITDSKNAVNVMFWANLPTNTLKDWQVNAGTVFVPYHNRETGEKIFVIISGNSAGEKDSWHTWHEFKTIDGALSATEMFSFEKVGGMDSNSSKFETLDWMINNISVSEEEFKTAITNFETGFNSEYEPIYFDYSNYSIRNKISDMKKDNEIDKIINTDTLVKFLLEFEGIPH